MSARSLLHGSCAVAAIAVAALPAMAQDEAVNPALPEIIVSAQLRPQPIETVPVALTALLSGEIEARGIDEPLDALRGIPNTIAAHVPGFGSDNDYVIRGRSGVATVIDGVYVGRGAATNYGFFDIDRIELLRGPQGPLYGRDTSGGVLHIVNRTPGDRTSGYLDGAYGRFGTYQFRAGLDVPIGERFSLGLSGYWRKSNGYVRNTTTGDRLNEDDGWGLRAAAHAKLSDTLTWTGSIARMESNALYAPDFECDPAALADCKGRFASTGYAETVGPNHFGALGVNGRKASFGFSNSAKTYLATSRIAWAPSEAVTFEAITGYVDTKRQYGIDLRDGRDAPTIAAPVPAARGDVYGGYTTLGDTHFKQFSQELRLGGTLAGGFVNYVAGVSYAEEDGDSDLADILTPATGIASLLADRRVTTETKSKSAYAQVDVNVTDALTLTGGLRYSDEDLRFGLTDNRAGCAALPGGCLDDALVTAGVPAKTSDSFWSPRFAASFKPNENATLFVSATRGYRSAGWNDRATTAATVRPYAAETIWSYEAGLKSTWFERRLAIDLTGFYADGSDAQIVDGGFDYVGTAGFRNKGVELEIAAVPLTNVTVRAAAGWQDAKYRAGSAVRAQQAACGAELTAGLIAGASGADNAPSCGTGIVTAAGDIADPVRAPKWTFSAGAAWDIWLPPVSGSIVTPSVDVTYRSAMETGGANASLYTGSVTGLSTTVYPANLYGGGFLSGSRSKSQLLVNAGIALRTDDNFWRVSLECENCLNETTVDASLGNLSWLNTPRVWMVRARRQF
ncbi:TonB-dependent receptor [Sphingosinicella microcystinivorans]|uniref:Iron complex outermembrane receptor protein n=1 Tax=Sphingosinicella microcystinivorans TaxID=335406 RepID=A0AAD1D3A8_SPHMI|nr:TonB-dependent receptor [Sphingosinicella microcystinivorans]RKS88902.1 iron complex outermembrane receptor protein [Sphingosinicella microcystinivorans]BBE32657.1 TonB-dependent receptor [Sphingosinicella microcystinivorans]